VKPRRQRRGVSLTSSGTTYKDGILQAKVSEDLSPQETGSSRRAAKILARYPNFARRPVFRQVRRRCDQQGAGARWPTPRAAISTRCIRHVGRVHLADHRKNANGEITKEAAGRTIGAARASDDPFCRDRFSRVDAPREWFLNRKRTPSISVPSCRPDLSKARWKDAPGRSSNCAAPGETRRSVVLRVTPSGTRIVRSWRRRSRSCDDWAIYRGGALFVQGAKTACWRTCSLDR